MITLALDASTYTASVALLRGDVVLRGERAVMRGADEERLLPVIAGLLEAEGLAPRELDRIVCGAGPGSFTSLRIAASTAKGLATAARIPVAAVSSLALLVAASHATMPRGRYVAALDALRGEHYVATCTVDDGGRITAVSAVERWPTAELRTRAAAIGSLVGPSLEVDAEPDVRALARVAPLLGAGAAVDLAAWEPDYGRLAEAQVKWEAAHGRPLPAS